MSEKKYPKFDIAVIGSGPGGYVGAIRAAMLGAKVVMIEKGDIGGICLNAGCIPTKSLVRSAEILDHVKDARGFGVNVDGYSLDMKKVIARKKRIVRQLSMGTEQLVAGNGVEIIRGKAYIIDKNSVEITNDDEKFTIEADNIIIATGAKSSTLNIPIEDHGNIIYSRQALEMDELPKSIVIVGGGVIGMEFAFIYSTFGVEVTVVEYLDRVLAMLDDDVTDELMKVARRKKIKVITNARVEEIIDSEDDGCLVKYMNNDEMHEIKGDKVLLSVGRTPFVEGLGLENVGVELNDNKRGIKVNDRMQTNVPGIYAIGDVTNIIQLAHVASHQGIAAVENIMGNDMIMDYTAIPSAIFTNPEISVVGLTERQAREQGRNISIGKFPFSASGKALVYGSRDGFVKVIKDTENDIVIGATMIGPHATDLISEMTLAIQNNITAKQISHTVHAHPTTAEAIHEAVLSTNDAALHFINKK
jgi:dihydrolipoamide dehydrogenase